MARIGIDLGTSYSCVGVYIDNKVEIIPNEEGKLKTPSFVSIINDERLVGESAKIQREINPDKTIFCIKGLLGNNTIPKEFVKKLPFEILTENRKRKLKIMSNKWFSPEQIASMILIKLKRNAETYLKRNVTNVVISVPAYFTQSQRQAIKIAGTIAGFVDIKLINEPTAAAIAYRENYINVNDQRNVLIFDMGGGKLDVSIITVCKNEIIVRGVFGDQYLGGEDFDYKILKYLLEELESKHDIKICENKSVLFSLLASCERAKCSLSSTISTQIKIDGILEKTGFNIPITRQKFEEINSDLFKRIEKGIEKAITNSKIVESNIQDLVLVGGSSRIPKIQELIQKMFFGKQLFKGLNADEAIAYGAAIQVNNLYLEPKLFEIKDITPFDLKMGIAGNKKKLIINHNQTIPVETKNSYETSDDNQTRGAVPVYENDGDRVLYIVEELPSKSIGEVKLVISFKLDSDGILNITAKDLSYEKIKYCITQPSYQLTKDEILVMIEDAKSYKKLEEKLYNIELEKNNLEEFCCKTKSSIKIEKSITEESKIEIINYLNEIMDNLDMLITLEGIAEKFTEVKTYLSRKVYT